jgi:hypothetical protein
MDSTKKSQPVRKDSRKGASDAAWEWRKFILQIVAIILSAVAILITVIMNKQQEQNNQNQFGTVEARLGKLDQPNLVAKVKVAFSPNYSDSLDQEYLDQVGMSRKNVGYDYFNQSLEEYLHPDFQEQKRYLFIQLMNEGPGIARQVRIDQVVWEPKPGIQPPAELSEVIGTEFGIVNPNQMLSFLVDAAPEISPTNPLLAAHASEICIEFSYTGYLDDSTWIRGKPLCISKASPAELEPMKHPE